jgi:hypothetical protein
VSGPLVADSAALIALERTGARQILAALFEEVLIPPTWTMHALSMRREGLAYQSRERPLPKMHISGIRGTVAGRCPVLPIKILLCGDADPARRDELR